MIDINFDIIVQYTVSNDNVKLDILIFIAHLIKVHFGFKKPVQA